MCVPFNVLITTGDGYSATIIADPDVASTLRAVVMDSQLRLTTTGGFTTRQPINATVTLPPFALQAVQVASPQSSVVVQAGVAGDELTAAHTGAGGLFLLDLNASSITINAAGYVALFKGTKCTAHISPQHCTCAGQRFHWRCERVHQWHRQRLPRWRGGDGAGGAAGHRQRVCQS